MHLTYQIVVIKKEFNPKIGEAEPHEPPGSAATARYKTNLDETFNFVGNVS